MDSIKMAEKKYCISMNFGGIANRLKCLTSIWRLADLYNRELILEWKRNHTCGSEFGDLFENNFKKIIEKELNEIKKREMNFFGDEFITIKDVQEKYLITGTWRFLLTPDELTKNPSLKVGGIDFLFSNIPEEIKKNISNYVKKFKPLKSIQKEVSDFQEKNQLDKMVGVHIRRGDFYNLKVSPGRVSSDEKFIEKMKEELKKNPKSKFFLCTDSKKVEALMEKKFPKRIIKFPKTSFIRTDVRATQEGLIDLLLLSKTKKILGTYRSTFTEMAWWFGGCKQEIEIIIDKKQQQELFKNIKKSKRKIIPKIKRILLKIIGRKFL